MERAQNRGNIYFLPQKQHNTYNQERQDFRKEEETSTKQKRHIIIFTRAAHIPHFTKRGENNETNKKKGEKKKI